LHVPNRKAYESGRKSLSTSQTSLLFELELLRTFAVETLLLELKSKCQVQTACPFWSRWIWGRLFGLSASLQSCFKQHSSGTGWSLHIPLRSIRGPLCHTTWTKTPCRIHHSCWKSLV